MTPKEEQPKRNVPDEREFLTRQAHILAQAEARAGVRRKRRSLLVAGSLALVAFALIALAFWLLNRG